VHDKKVKENNEKNFRSKRKSKGSLYGTTSEGIYGTGSTRPGIKKRRLSIHKRLHRRIS